jgi:glyoxylase-like metal-dependent hydrolase (beta-lactamase superfamily II)
MDALATLLDGGLELRVHHLNCMTFFLGVRGVTHCLLVETPEGLLLVDTGLGRADYERPPWRVRLLITVNRVPCDPQETAINQVIQRGYTPEDVRHIVLTHMHPDHCGGLPDFPWAKVHVSATEYAAAAQPRFLSFLDQVGLEPAHWAHGPDWVLHQEQDRSWFGLDCMPVVGTEESGVLLVPLPGHSLGHCGVAVSADDHWLLHCGDAFVRDSEVDPHSPRSPFPKWFGSMERAVFPAEARERVRGLLRGHSNEVKAFCSHDPIAFEQLAGCG